MKPNDYLRSFGMSGLLITNELQDVEKRFNLELGHVPRVSGQSAAEYYPHSNRKFGKKPPAWLNSTSCFIALSKQSAKSLLNR